MKAGVIAGVLVLVLIAEQAGAVSKAKQCQRACGGLIAACATRIEDLGDFRRACKVVVLKRCKREGDHVCFAATTSTIPAETSTTTTSTSTTTSTTTTTLRFVDNGDGTVTDRSTGLMWEKKDDGGGLHDKDGSYTWFEANSTFVSDVNGRTDATNPQAPGLGGHNDWRLPTIDELQTILLAPFPCGPSPCIDPIFGPTVASLYWSSTTRASGPTGAWFVNFDSGFAFNGDKSNAFYVRAVRNGS